jgi:hypothetical protein
MMIKRCKTDPIVGKTLTKALKQSEALLATNDVMMENCVPTKNFNFESLMENK